MNFDESKHPRDRAGKFTDGTTDYSEYRHPQYLIRQNGHEGRPDILAGQSADEQKKQAVNNKRKSQEEFFGEEFKGVKGAEAIEKLLKEERGHVKNAFERPEIGGIDLVWGDESGGLCHAIQRRNLFYTQKIGKISGLNMARMIPEIIEKGEFSIDSKDRPRFEYNGYRVAVKPSYFNKKLNWIVTAMEIKNPKEN